MKKTKINTNLLRKFSLKDKILKENCTIEEAAISFDMLACEAEEILFNREPQKKHIAEAIKLYQTGRSIQYCCVAFGIKPNILVAALKTIRSKTVVSYRFKEEFSWIS
jgi:hypothetical protein